MDEGANLTTVAYFNIILYHCKGINRSIPADFDAIIDVAGVRIHDCHPAFGDLAVNAFTHNLGC